LSSELTPAVEGTEPDDGALRSPSGAALTVEDALVRAPFALAGDTDVLSAAQQLVAAQHRVVLVTAEPDAGTSGGGGTLLLAGGAASVRVVGIVTVDDLLRTLESDKDRPAADALIRGEWAATGVARPPAICVGDVCTVMCLEDVCDAPPPAVRVDEALSEAMTAQLAGMYGALLVVAGHGGGGDEEDGARRSENDAGELLGVVTRESAALAKALASY
jgi:CBS domain-containing protein